MSVRMTPGWFEANASTSQIEEGKYVFKSLDGLEDVERRYGMVEVYSRDCDTAARDEE